MRHAESPKPNEIRSWRLTWLKHRLRSLTCPPRPNDRLELPLRALDLLFSVGTPNGAHLVLSSPIR